MLSHSKASVVVQAVVDQALHSVAGQPAPFSTFWSPQTSYLAFNPVYESVLAAHGILLFVINLVGSPGTWQSYLTSDFKLTLVL